MENQVMKKMFNNVDLPARTGRKRK